MYNNTIQTVGIYADGDTMVCVSIVASEACKPNMRETHVSLVRG